MFEFSKRSNIDFFTRSEREEYTANATLVDSPVLRYKTVVALSRFHWLFSLVRLIALSTAAATIVAAGAAHGADRKGGPMSYRESRDFLAKHTRIIELANDAGARLAIAPEWQGRVMTSTLGGVDGPSFGFVNRSYIEAGKLDRYFNNYGAEDRFWLSPEGGQFGLFFQAGAKQSAAGTWYTPPALNEGAWNVVSAANDPAVRMAQHMRLENASGTPFELDVARDVRLLATDDVRELFGAAAAQTIGQTALKWVGFETVNTIANRGPAFAKEKGLVSIWILGQMNAGPQTVAIIPYRPGPEAQRGPVVKSDYCGAVPAERLKIIPAAVLFRTDSKFRSKIGTSQSRGRNVLGSIDFQTGVLTLVQFTIPGDPAKEIYLNNMCEVPQAEPYRGDVANIYNDGPNQNGQQFGAFYEMETLSPARVLKTGESLSHRNRTIHVQADAATLRQLAQETLGVDLEAVRRAFP